MWIAKNKDTGKEYPKKFKDIYDCQYYIDNELKEDLKKANELFCENYAKSHHGFPPIWYCNRILCFNTGQQRFCDGFDF